MVPKIHPKGTSFKGLAQYVLHDKGRATTHDRVEWVRTRNLATQNGHAAWRVMAATAMEAHRLKARAGVKSTGRKSARSVMHVTLSWRPDESAGLTKEAMLSAADGAIRALGAEDRQAIIVAHNDETHPHIHLVINRISPTDGRMLSSSKERFRLSRWALELEKKNGKILCEQREINWRARDRSEYTRGQKDTPRHIHELKAEHEGRSESERVAAEQGAHDQSLGRETRRMRRRHGKEWTRLLEGQREGERAIRDGVRLAAGKAVQAVRDEYAPRWKELYRSQAAELEAFSKREQTLAGRARNALRGLDVRRLFSRGQGESALSSAYNAITSEGGRLGALKASHEKAERELLQAQKKAERAGTREARASGKAELRASREKFDADRSTLIFRHSMEESANRAAWNTRSKQRRAAWDAVPEVSNSQAPEPRTLEDRLREQREARQQRPRRPRRKR